jgi:outer membrane usher protein FimD/PapC
MRYITIVVALLLTTTSQASELTFKFKSPAFSGEGFSSHALTIDNQEQTRRQKLADEKKTELAKAAADAKNTNLARFINNLESRVYATISQKIAEELFKSGSSNSGGSFDVAGNNVNWSSVGNEITLRITDAAGAVTEIVVPTGSLAW